MESRILFLDDSGKPEVAHASRAVVLAGLAIDSQQYPTFSRRVLGAKGRFYKRRGAPERWEMKSGDFVTPNPWNRANNRNFIYEIARIMGTVGATTYSATIVKSRMLHAMTLATTMPLQLQRLIEHFDVECRSLERHGIVIADWSSHDLDQHASRCVASFVASRKIDVHPCMYYANSNTNEAIQVADLISAIRRRVAEGDVNLSALDAHLHAITSSVIGIHTYSGRPFSNMITVV